MNHRLFNHQRLAANQLKTGSILCGGVGSGKTLTALTYYFEKERPKDLYIITTAGKRDTLDWERECANFMLSRDRTASIDGVQVLVDSWNNIKKYIKVENAFFIFDEQRVIGSGAWVKSFLKITKNNNWILLSATPGDTWLDYVPVFIANGFYKNRTEFIRRHVVYNSFTKFPKVDRYIEQGRLLKLKKQIMVIMSYNKKVIKNSINILVEYDNLLINSVKKKRWNPYTNTPIKQGSEMFYTLRRIINSNESRIKAIKELITRHRKIIIFYNFNYELDILKKLKDDREVEIAEYNGHKHQPIPKSQKWCYLVQYISGAEGWNCIETNTIVFYSENYSYRMMTQAAGRIDRLNTPFAQLYYYHLISRSLVDQAIVTALQNKEDFNETSFIKSDKFLKGEL